MTNAHTRCFVVAHALPQDELQQLQQRLTDALQRGERDMPLSPEKHTMPDKRPPHMVCTAERIANMQLAMQQAVGASAAASAHSIQPTSGVCVDRTVHICAAGHEVLLHNYPCSTPQPKQETPMTAKHLPYPAPTDAEMDVKALELLRALHGLPVSSAMAVLNQARMVLTQCTRLDCSSSDFAQAERVLTPPAAG